MLSFSGWDLYGNASVTARTQGVSMLLNMFFGPLMNAAAGIATQVQNAVMAFAGNFIVAVRPQIVKQYAAGEYESMFKLLKEAIVLCFTLLSLLSVPLMCEAHFVLKIWLKIVPDYAVIFCNFTLLFNIFASISILLVSVVHATGKIFRPSFINGSLYLLVIPFTYVAFKLGCEPWVSFLFNVVAVVIGMTSNAWTIKLYVSGFPFKEILLKYFLRCVLILFSVYGMVYSLHFILDEGWGRLMLSIFSSSILLSLGAFYILLTSSSRARLVSYLKKKLWKKGLVSVLTPCYNTGRYVHRLLDSVLTQTYPFIEMVIIDDGSTDDSSAVIQSYIPKFKAKGYELRYYYQKNSGQSVAIERKVCI